MTALLSLTDLTITHPANPSAAPLLSDISLSIDRGQRLGLIGESGSGKSLTALAIIGLLPPALQARGEIDFAGTDILRARERELNRIRGQRIAMVFQEPMSALDPLMSIGRHLELALGQQRRAEVAERLSEVGLAEHHARRYPHELSGGQRQRVLIALAMAGEPELLICDEPTTALDATTADAVLSLIDEVARRRGTAVLFISHDLAVIRRMCPQVAVLQRGVLVESGSTETVLSAPQHPYTAALVAATDLPQRPALSRTEPPAEPVIEMRDVVRRYGATTALAGLNLTVPRGTRLGIAGGSGTGKTTALKLIAGLEPPSSGDITVTGRVHMVFQDPLGSLNPRLPIWKIVAEGLGPLQLRLSRAQLREQVAAILQEVGITDALDRYPHQFSGGQRQRISLARALISQPDILLADEAVSALDVSVRAQVLAVLDRVVSERQLSLVFISHDLAVIRALCDDVAIIHQGTIVESGPSAQVWQQPSHPYTQALLRAARQAHPPASATP